MSTDVWVVSKHTNETSYTISVWTREDYADRELIRLRSQEKEKHVVYEVDNYVLNYAYE